MVTQKSFEGLDRFRSLLSSHPIPSYHVVLGSGFANALDTQPSGWTQVKEFSFEELPGIKISNTPGHSGRFRIYSHQKTQKTVLVQMGRLHGYEGNPPQKVILPVMLSRLSGVHSFVLTNASGGLHSDFHVGDVMMIADHVNMTGQNPLVGPNPLDPEGKPLGTRFPDMSRAYHPQWVESLGKSFSKESLRVHRGTYIGVLGPSYETPAEIQLFKKWGMDAVGMSTVWETIALRHSGAKVVGAALISNAAAGLGDGKPLDHSDILITCRESAHRIVTGIFGWVERELL